MIITSRCLKRRRKQQDPRRTWSVLVVLLLLLSVCLTLPSFTAADAVDPNEAGAVAEQVVSADIAEKQPPLNDNDPKQEVNIASDTADAADFAAHNEHLHRLRVHSHENEEKKEDQKIEDNKEAKDGLKAENEHKDPAAVADAVKSEMQQQAADVAEKMKAEAAEGAENSLPAQDAPAGETKPKSVVAEESPKEKVLHVVGARTEEQKTEEAKQKNVKPAAAELPKANDTKPATITDENHDEDEIGESAAKSDESDDEEENPEDYYFYAFDEESPVIELPRYEGDSDLAPFINNPNPGEIRILEFYAHWCPHCEKFRPKYNKFAKRMLELAEQSGLTLKVYAISCVPHKSICRGSGVKNYPRIKMYLADSTTPIDLNHKKVHPFEVLKKLGAENVFTDVEEDWDKEDEEEDHNHAPDSAAALLGSGKSFWIPRTKKEIYHDAYLSFDFMMRNSIFTSKDPMSEEAQEAFADFIHVLSEVLPPTWRLQWLAAEIAENIEESLQSEETLLAIADKYPPKKKKWSKSCSRGKGHMGYTCGLWQLFHIMTLGVVEWNFNNVAGKKKTYYSTDEAAEVLRYFIEHFFGCEVCKVNFMQEYDSCSFNRCERLAGRVGEFDDWKELPLWLFEFHNGVNTRLLKERAEAQGATVSLEEMTAVEWPARNHCPACWHDDGRFDPDRVYMFLELIYWPDELISKSKMAELVAFTSHKQRLRGMEEENPIPEEKFESWVYSLAGLVVASSVLSAASWVHKRKEIQRTGKHKKEDDDNNVKC